MSYKDKERNNEYMRRYREENSEKIRKYYRDYNKNIRSGGINPGGESKKQWNYKNRYKRKAHSAFQRALNKGIVKKLTCFICNNNKVHAHHSDYSKPLLVTWLCPLHHSWVHSGKINLSINEIS